MYGLIARGFLSIVSIVLVNTQWAYTDSVPSASESILDKLTLHPTKYGRQPSQIADRQEAIGAK